MKDLIKRGKHNEGMRKKLLVYREVKEKLSFRKICIRVKIYIKVKGSLMSTHRVTP